MIKGLQIGNDLLLYEIESSTEPKVYLSWLCKALGLNYTKRRKDTFGGLISVSQLGIFFDSVKVKPELELKLMWYKESFRYHILEDAIRVLKVNKVADILNAKIAHDKQLGETL